VSYSLPMATNTGHVTRGPSGKRQSSSRGTEQPGKDRLLEFVEHLRGDLERIDAYARAAEHILSQTSWGINRRYRREFCRLSCYLTEAAEAISGMIDEYDIQLAAVMRYRTGSRKR
jgi:hypothetical protein